MGATRREFIKLGAAASGGLYLSTKVGGIRRVLHAAIPGGTLSPYAINKYVTPLLVPPAMPRAGKVRATALKNIDYYEIAMRQFQQQVLPAGMPKTMVWGYGPDPATVQGGPVVFHAPSLTIEAKWNRPVRVKWINELVDENGHYLSHLLPVDPTLHWANPPGGIARRDSRSTSATTPGRYTGPVPIVTHVHGAVGVRDDSDGYAEAWYLPAATNIPEGYAAEGTWYDFFKTKAKSRYGVQWGAGFATFQYPNTNRASTIWYHDHTLGMTRLNVYAGPAGFFIIRGGPNGDGAVLDVRSGSRAVLPGPAPAIGDPSGTTYFEIPIAIQDRAFNADGSLFYPDTRTFFDGIAGPFVPNQEGFAPIWNPEFFGNCLIANGATWPFLDVQQCRYRLRFLNGCQSRFLILDFSSIPGVEVWQIGNEGGFLAQPVPITQAHNNRLLLGLAERADLIVDFTNVPRGNHVLYNLGPDEPFGGGAPGVDFMPSDSESTGQVLRFQVGSALRRDPSTPAQYLVLPALQPLPAESVTRSLALIEKTGEGAEASGNEVEGPLEALLGTVDGGVPREQSWKDPVTENPAIGSTEVWEFYNLTGDAHPVHVHEVVFEVVNREGLVMDGDDVATPMQADGNVSPPEPWETGVKDTVIAYPRQVTRIRAQFKTPGQFAWHCHIVEHEDNEMMRPYRIGAEQEGQPGSALK